jgi:small multidrug resistance pump
MEQWFFLAGAIALEVIGTTFMKLSDGLTKTLPIALMLLFYVASFLVLTLALRKIEVGIAYAVWSGVGTALIALIGIVYFQETVTPFKLIGISLIILGVIGINLGSSH